MVSPCGFSIKHTVAFRIMTIISVKLDHTSFFHFAHVFLAHHTASIELLGLPRYCPSQLHCSVFEGGLLCSDLQLNLCFPHFFLIYTCVRMCVHACATPTFKGMCLVTCALMTDWGSYIYALWYNTNYSITISVASFSEEITAIKFLSSL